MYFIGDLVNSTDFSLLFVDVPPAIEPRQDKKKPIPPPRPSKTLNIVPNPAIVNKSTSHNRSANENVPSTMSVPGFIEVASSSSLANVIALKSSSSSHRNVPEVSSPKEMGSGVGNESPLELHTSVVSGKALTLKKKNSLMSKRRKVSLKSFTSSDIQGHLYRRAKNRHGMSYWAKLYIVLIDTTLYGFKTKEAIKADCLIFLPGFTVTRAQEVHSKEFAFKVYHPSKTFYFAAETEEAQQQWIDYIHQATLKGIVGQKAGGPVKDTKELFSETDSSDDETGSFNLSQMATPSPLMTYGSSSGSGKTNSGEPSTPTTTKSEGKYHLGFGSLKKSLRNLNSSEGSPSDNKFLSLFSSSRHSERKNSLDIPVPTSQFKSYRKMPVKVNLQAGTVTVNNRVADYPAVPSPKPAFEFPKRPSETFIFKTDMDLDPEEEEPIFEKVELGRQEAKKVVQKPSGYNHMHASNPNLVEFSVAGYAGAPKDIELTCPKTSSMNRDWDASHNTSGFMTLKDLMLLEQAENAKDPYNKRVCLGIEKHDDKNQGLVLNNVTTVPVKNEESPASTKINKIQKRSLPVTPDYAQSFKPDDQDILYTRSREGLKLRDFGYELITGDDRVELKNNLQAAQQASHDEAAGRNKKTSKQNSNNNETVMQSVKKRSMNWMHSSSGGDKDKFSIGGSFNKKQKNKSVVIEKFDHLMASSEKLFHFKHVNTANETENLKSKHTNVKSNVNVTTNWNLAENHNMVAPSSASMTTPSGGAVPQTSDRGASYLTKLSFSNKTSKEKKLLGSPRLHRAFFGHRNNGERDEPKAVDHEIFSPLNFNNKVSQFVVLLISF